MGGGPTGIQRSPPQKRLPSDRHKLEPQAMTAPRADHQAELGKILRDNRQFMQLLTVARALALPDWAIGAGFIRTIVWDRLENRMQATPARDVDLVYFDPRDISEKRDKCLEARLGAALPGVPWEVTNQAGVHRWYHDVFGYRVEPLTSTLDAVGTWPDTASSVAVRLEDDDSLTIMAPCGLDDLFGMIMRRNPRRVTRAIYEERLARRPLLASWPSVRIIHG